MPLLTRSINPGIHGPIGVDITQVYALGFDAFPTPYTRSIAASELVKPTWSKCHAHFSHESFDSLVEGDVKGVKITDEEVKRLEEFHDQYLKDKVMQYPHPVNRAGVLPGRDSSYTYKWVGLPPAAPGAGQHSDWVLDTDGPFIENGGRPVAPAAPNVAQNVVQNVPQGITHGTFNCPSSFRNFVLMG